MRARCCRRVGIPDYHTKKSYMRSIYTLFHPPFPLPGGIEHSAIVVTVSLYHHKRQMGQNAACRVARAMLE